MGNVQSRVYLFDEQDYEFVLKQIFRPTKELVDFKQYLEKKYANKPYMLKNLLDERVETFGMLLEEIVEELKRFIPEKYFPLCHYRFFGDTTLLVIKYEKR